MSGLANTNKTRKVVAAFKRAGFKVEPGGKHQIITDSRGNMLSTIPNAREVNKNTLRAILKQIGLSEKRFLKLY